MTIQVGKWTKFALAATGLSLAMIVLMGDESCVSNTTPMNKLPGGWVACVGGTPTLMWMNDKNQPEPFPGSGLAQKFDAADWDCDHPADLGNAAGSCSVTHSSAFPHYNQSDTPVYGVGTAVGPVARSVKPRAATSGTAYLPQQFLALPFLPPFSSAAPPTCDSSYPDVLQTVNTRARVARISTCPFKLITTIPVPDQPLQVAITPDGTTALVTSFSGAVSFIDLLTNKIIYTLKTDPTINPSGIAILPDGSRAYITSFSNSTPVVQTIDLTSRKIIATLNVYQWPEGARLTPDGSQLWITSMLSPTVAVVDTLTNTFVTGLPIPQSTDVAFNSTGTRAYITSTPGATGPGNVVVVDTKTYQIVKTYKVGQNPADIAMMYGDGYLIVNNDDGGSISVIDLVKDTVTTTAVGANPSGISVVH